MRALGLNVGSYTPVYGPELGSWPPSLSFFSWKMSSQHPRACSEDQMS